MKNKKIKHILPSLLMLVGLPIALTACGSTTTTTQQQNVKIKKVGVKRLAQAQSKKDTLDREKKDKEKEYQKLQDQLTEQKDQEKKEKEQQKQEENKQQKQQSVAQEQSSIAPSSNKGDLNTAATGQIVGNSRSHIYHVPGQAGYNMSSKNAVYFNSEQEAIAAGYRKALR